MGEGDVPLFDIPRPCSIEWSSMSGEGAARTCGRCQRAVHDFSVLSTPQIQALVTDSSQRICARIDAATARRSGANQLKIFALSTMLTAVGVAAAASRTDASTSGSTSIRGVVRDGDQPLAHIEVRANPQGPGAISVTRTDERGGYAFEGLKPGSYVISFGGFSVPHEPAHGSWDADVEVCKGTTLVLESSSPPDVMGEVVVEVQPPDVIAGRVTSQKHADGLSGAIVTLLRPSDGFRRTARTDAYGRYRIAELEPGHYILTGEAQGFLTRSTGLDLNGQPTEQFFAPGSASERVGDIALCPYRVAR